MFVWKASFNKGFYLTLKIIPDQTCEVSKEGLQMFNFKTKREGCDPICLSFRTYVMSLTLLARIAFLSTLGWFWLHHFFYLEEEVLASGLIVNEIKGVLSWVTRSSIEKPVHLRWRLLSRWRKSWRWMWCMEEWCLCSKSSCCLSLSSLRWLIDKPSKIGLMESMTRRLISDKDSEIYWFQ